MRNLSPTSGSAAKAKFKAVAKAEYQALALLHEVRRNVITSLFKGTKLRFNHENRFKTQRDAAQDGLDVFLEASKVHAATRGVSQGTTKFSGNALQAAGRDFVKQCSDLEDIQDVVNAITSQALNDLLNEITPFLGIALGAAKIKALAAEVHRSARLLFRQHQHVSGFRPGDPQTAAESVIRLIRGELTRNSIDLTKETASTGAKIAGLFADAGTASTLTIGMANAVAGLGLSLYKLGIDIKYQKAGNARLDKGDLQADVFNECPVLGCYMLTCVDTSTAANFFISDVGLPGWMDRLEQMKRKQMDPLLDMATRLIDNSTLQLDGLRSNKGVFLHKKKTWFAKKRAEWFDHCDIAEKWLSRYTS
ncbi:MAG: hypothetical protein VYA51_01930 [Planctomycetota bacterium]|nr:hypothetical protein [Planctomycetota bacterium]